MIVTFKQGRFEWTKELCSWSVQSADEDDLAMLSNSVLWLCCRVPYGLYFGCAFGCGVERLFQQRFGSMYSMYCSMRWTDGESSLCPGLYAGPNYWTWMLTVKPVYKL